MPLLGSDVLAAARQALVEFGEVEFAADADLLLELHMEDRRILQMVNDVGNASYPLDELCASVDSLGIIRSPFPLPADAWLLRRVYVNFSDGASRETHRVDPAHHGIMPALVPALYVAQRLVHLLDGLHDSPVGDLSARRWGWDGAAALKLWYIPEPAALATADDPLGSPRDALPYLSRYIAAKLAVRAKLEEVPLRILEAQKTKAREDLLEHVADFGRTDA